VADLGKAARSCYCAEPRPADIGRELVLKGWAHSRRDHGGLIFIDLRDRTGICQVVLDPSRLSAEKFEEAHGLRNEYVLAVRGVVLARLEGTANPNLPTGEIELKADDFEILNVSRAIPFRLDEYGQVNEDIRLRYRYLDLRRPEMQRNMMMRAKVTQAARGYLDSQGFIEFETPILIKSTPEGARDFLVPSRLLPGNFYALPQSPQIFKQILMVAGFDKYYQIARCFRDEDLRADRQPEFTQIDIEMSFVTLEDIYAAAEGLMKHIYREALGYDLPTPFPRLTHAEAMLRYGTDKPDLRFGLEIVDLTELLKAGGCDFKVFNQVIESGGVVRAFRVPAGGAMYSTTQLKPEGDLNKTVRAQGVGGLAWFRVEEASASASGGLSSNIAKFFSPELLSKIRDAMGGKPGDLLLIVADRSTPAAVALGQLRLKVAKENNLVTKGKPCFLWITTFPFFHYDEKTKQYEVEHHPFTMPFEEDLDALRRGDLAAVRAQAYDIVLDGNEIASGSIRINRQDIQSLIFSKLGIDDAAARQKFGFLLEAFEYGAPPHGGIAPGLDRLVMLMVGETSIREVIPFPKTQTGACLMSGTPTAVSRDQLKDLWLEVVEPPEK